MRYRQWKKNYKKRYGVNPPASIDKRKQCKQARQALNRFIYADFSKTIIRAADSIKDILSNFMREMGRAFDTAGTVCKNVADSINPLEIKENTISWEVKPIVCDYGVYQNCALDGSSELKLITNSRRAAEKIVEIMQQDHLDHMKMNYLEKIQKHISETDI